MDEQRSELVAALGGGRLVLHYQPIVDAESGETRAVETLARWQDADGQVRGAGWLFGRLEECAEHRVALDRWVIERMLEERASYGALGRCKISVNQDRASVTREAVRSFVDRSVGLEGGPLSVELFEHLDSEQLAGLPALAEEFADAGIEIWHDDFGTGEQALAHLMALPSTVVKLCPEVAADGVASARVRLHVRALIRMLHDLGKIVIGEGVADAASAEWLGDAGADWLQGWHYARPMPAPEAAEWLRGWEPRAA